MAMKILQNMQAHGEVLKLNSHDVVIFNTTSTLS